MARDLLIVRNGGDYAFYVDGKLAGAMWPEPRLEVLTRLMGVEVLDLGEQLPASKIDFIREAPTVDDLKRRVKELRREKRERRIQFLEKELRELRSQEEEPEQEGPVRESDK